MEFTDLLKSTLAAAHQTTRCTSLNYDRLLNVHPSQLPICSTSFIKEWIESQTINGDCLRQNLASMITLDVGTTIHHCMQTFMPLATSDMFGSWKCNNCGKVIEACKKPSKCPNCEHTQFSYEELAIHYKGFHGHIDTILEKDGKYAIVDYKTTSLLNLEKKAANPGLNYQLQIRSYALLCKLQYKMTVSDVYLVFIAKEAPTKYTLYHESIDSKVLKETFDFLKYQRELKSKLLRVSTFEEFMELDPEPCGNQYCAACGSTASNKHKETLKWIKDHWSENLFPIINVAQERINGVPL